MRVIDEVITAVGGRGQLATLLGVSLQFVGQMAKGQRPIPARRCSLLEAATGIPRERMRPDVFGSGPADSSDNGEAA